MNEPPKNQTPSNERDRVRKDLAGLIFDIITSHISIDEIKKHGKEKNKPADWDVLARRSLCNLVQDFAGVPELKENIQNLRSGIDKITTQLNDYQKKLEVHVGELIPPGDLKTRFELEYPTEKAAIAKYIVAKYFSSSRKCFLQASTFILHLAEAFRKDHSGRDCLIHTNSTVFPWLVLGHDSKYTVYSCCGQFHDPLCCGWLFGSNDKQARDHVHELFHRKHDPIDTAFVTPQHMTVNGELFFALEGTQELVEILVREAPNLVITMPLQRLRKDSNEISRTASAWYSVDVSKLRQNRSSQKSEVVLAGFLDKSIFKDKEKAELSLLEQFASIKQL